MLKLAIIAISALSSGFAHGACTAQGDRLTETFDEFQAFVGSPLLVAVVNGDRKLDSTVIEEAIREDQRVFGELVPTETFDGWDRKTQGTLVERGAQFALIIKRVTVKKGKTIAHNFGKSFLSSKGQNVQYTGASCTTHFEVHYLSKSKWIKAASWSWLYDRTALPGGVNMADVKDGKLVVDPSELVRPVLRRGLRSGFRAIQLHSVDAPFGSAVEWASRLDPAEQSEFWQRLSTIPSLECPMDWRGLDELAIEQWRHAEKSGASAGTALSSIRAYCSARGAQADSVAAAERALRRMRDSAASTKPEHWLKKRRPAGHAVFLNDDVLDQLDLSRSRMPRLAASKLRLFGKDDMKSFKAKKSKRRFISLAHALFIVSGKHPKYELEAKVTKPAFDATTLDEALVGAFGSRWPSDRIE